MGWSAARATGLTVNQAAYTCKGYTLLAPINGDAAYLLDMEGRIVQQWRTPGFRTFQAQLLDNGHLLTMSTDASLPPPAQPAFHEAQPPFEQQIRRLGGAATHLLELDWEGKVVWEYANRAIHHDCIRLANGNTLVPEWVELPVEVERAVKGGVRRPREKFARLIADDFIEVTPAGAVASRIHLWQLLDPARDPICPLEARREWTHTNSLALTGDGGLVFSCRENSRVGVIDRASGTLRWKWGGGYDANETKHQHHATPVPGGNIQFFDNGMHRLGLPFSRIVEIDPRTNTIVWEYTGSPGESFFSAHISGAERQSNGNVLICEGASGRIFEVTRRGETVWEWVSPFMGINRGSPRPWVFRARRYAPDHPALAGRDLDPARWVSLNRLYGLGD